MLSPDAKKILRADLEVRLQKIQDVIINTPDETTFRMLQGRAQILKELLRDYK